MKPTVHYVVLTGGPCGGKTTALVAITEWLEGAGYRVVVCPEGATTLILNGVSPTQLTPRLFQWALLDFELAKEMSFRRIAHRLAQKRQQPVVVLMDRAWHDGGAYTPEDLWREMMEEADAKKLAPLSGYDGIVHLVTAADGAEAYYTLENNQARFESPEEARQRDRALVDVYQPADHRFRIANESPFDVKIRRAIGAVCRIVGIPEPLEIERKFLVVSYDPKALAECSPVQVDISQFYVEEDGSRYRRRELSDGTVSFSRTWKREEGCGSGEARTETSRPITASEFEEARVRHRNARSIAKRRFIFDHGSYRWELDEFFAPGGLVLLEAETPERGETVVPPPFIKVSREVTSEREFRNEVLARSR
ncbi:MAG TPA: AAA family ATPase [Candidatus Paceibacterota bacterium]